MEPNEILIDLAQPFEQSVLCEETGILWAYVEILDYEKDSPVARFLHELDELNIDIELVLTTKTGEQRHCILE